MKKPITLLMAALLLISLTVPVLAAKNTVSSAFLLEKTTGTVTVTSGSGKTVTKKTGMHLHSGYSVDTEKRSYAYISLDDAKVIKLDASSQAQIEASGKKLELNVTEGSIFFEVSKPLTSKETLTIRTSTMVTGIRGTCGWVTSINRYTTQISLLEGELTITSIDPLTSQTRTTVITGGQTATIVFRGTAPSSPDNSIPEDETIQNLIDDGTIQDEHIIIADTGLTVERLQEEHVPGFVAVEVKNDPDLQKRIEENSPLSVPEIIGNAEERLAQEEAVAEKEEKVIQDALENLQVEEVDPVFGQSASSEFGGGGSSGGGGSITYFGLTVKHQTADGTPIPAIMDEISEFEANSPYSVSPQNIVGYQYNSLDPNSDPLSGIMDSHKTVILIYEPVASYTLEVSSATYDYDQDTNTFVGSAAVPTPESLTPGQPYTITAPTGYIIAAVSGDGAISMNDTRTSATGTMDSDKTISVQYFPSAISLTNPTTAQINTIIENYAAYSIPSNINLTLNITGNITLDTSSSVEFPGNYIVNLSGTTSLASGITLDTEAGTQLNVASGTFTNNGTISGQGTMTVASGAILDNQATIQIESTNSLHVQGSLLNNNTVNVGTADAVGLLAIENNGSFTNNGTLTINAGSSATLATGTTLTNDATGTITNNGTLSVASGATMNNAGALTLANNSFSCEGTYHDTRTTELMATIKTGSAITWVGAANTLPDSVPSGAEVQLLGAASGAMTNINSTFTLDLNGRQVGSNPGYISFTVQQGLTLTLKDSSGNNSGAFTNRVSNNGTLIIEGGTITAASGTALMNASTGTLTINGGVIGGDTCAYGVQNSNVMTMNGGTISGTSAGVSISGGSLTVNDGEISGTYGVYMNGGSLTLENGSITAVRCGIYDRSTASAVITIAGGTVRAERSGISDTIYGIYTDNDGPTSETAGTVINITGGTVSASINAGDSYAYGIYCSYDSVPTSVTIGNAMYTSTSTGAIQPEGITVSGDDAAVYFIQTN